MVSLLVLLLEKKKKKKTKQGEGGGIETAGRIVASFSMQSSKATSFIVVSFALQRFLHFLLFLKAEGRGM